MIELTNEQIDEVSGAALSGALIGGALGSALGPGGVVVGAIAGYFLL